MFSLRNTTKERQLSCYTQPHWVPQTFLYTNRGSAKFFAGLKGSSQWKRLTNTDPDDSCHVLVSIKFLKTLSCLIVEDDDASQMLRWSVFLSVNIFSLSVCMFVTSRVTKSVNGSTNMLQLILQVNTESCTISSVFLCT